MLVAAGIDGEGDLTSGSGLTATGARKTTGRVGLGAGAAGAAGGAGADVFGGPGSAPGRGVAFDFEDLVRRLTTRSDTGAGKKGGKKKEEHEKKKCGKKSGKGMAIEMKSSTGLLVKHN